MVINSQICAGKEPLRQFGKFSHRLLVEKLGLGDICYPTYTPVLPGGCTHGVGVPSFTPTSRVVCVGGPQVWSADCKLL